MHFLQRGLVWALLIGVGFGAGYWLGRSDGEAADTLGDRDTRGTRKPDQHVAAASQADAAQQAVSPAHPGAKPDTNSGTLAAMLAGEQWYQATQWLQAPGQPLTPDHGTLLVQAIRQNMNKYDALAMRRMLNLYLQEQPDDTAAWFLLADLQILEGLQETALQTLLGVMAGGYGAAEAGRARREADRLIETITQGLRNRGALRDLAQFWQSVSTTYPSSDAYRYRWARSLMLAGQLDEAESLLAEIGTTDVSQVSLDELATEIEQARRGPGFTQRNGQLVATVSEAETGTERFELLVDTGANVTSLSRRALRALQATPTGRNVQVRTAGGTVETAVYFVPSMYVQGRQITNLRTLQLPSEMLGLDGLLGTDVLRRLDWMPVDSL